MQMLLLESHRLTNGDCAVAFCYNDFMNKLKEQNYWFKTQSHIWQPISWQGWFTVLLFAAIVFGNALVVVVSPYSNELLWLYLNVLAVSVATVLFVAYAKGPKAE